MKIGVVVFPGSNCDRDTLYLGAQLLGIETVPLWHKSHDLEGCDFIILPGGFSYGDYLRSGAIARFAPIMQEVVAHASKGGYVMGICNGFQILTEAQLLPGALLRNNSRLFSSKPVHLKAQTLNTLITGALQPNEILEIPIAHGEGRFYLQEEGLKALHDNDQVLFRYCDAQGMITEASNPNGSLENIAGVCNEGRNVFGMMPHPERAADPVLGSTDGLRLFEWALQLAD